MIYFDNAATSFPKPAPVLAAAERAISLYGGNPGRGGHRLSLASAEMVYACRERIAEFFSYPAPEKVVFTGGATMALNLAIRAHTEEGAHILISDREHNAVYRTVHQLCLDGRCSYTVFSTSGDIIAEIKSRLTPSTTLLVVTETSNVTGFTLPIARIGELCREQGLAFIIDASQSAGHFPIDLSHLYFNAFCAPAHKGLLGIMGLGFLILPHGEKLPPFLLGGSGTASLSPLMPPSLPERMEAGTLPVPAIAALNAGLDFLKRYGVARVREEEQRLKQRALEGLLSLPDILLYEPHLPAGLLAFNHPRFAPERIAYLLDRRGIATRAGYHCAPLAHRTIGTGEGGCVRLSFGLGNRPEEVDAFLKILTEIIKKEQ